MKRIDPFPTDIFSLYPSQYWGLFRVHYWQPICEEIYKDALKTMFIPVNRQVALYYDFFMQSLDPDSPESIMVNKKSQHFKHKPKEEYKMQLF